MTRVRGLPRLRDNLSQSSTNSGQALSARSPVPGCIKARGSDEDALNICCRKAKRDAEAAGTEANELAQRLEKALQLRDEVAAGKLSALEAREAFPVPGCIKRSSDEDAMNVCCRKLKRDAEKAAENAAEAYSSYTETMAYRQM